MSTPSGENPFHNLDPSLTVTVPERAAARAKFCGGIGLSGYEGMYEEFEAAPEPPRLNFEQEGNGFVLGEN
jgi:hypothetical protein